ncbi:MAG: SRPBCC family protein [Gemmatimonadaceae bacterium]|jgi:uncharacterized protein YndB with AHSA1/START domain|nr:SRPBCC family protein [Gemmatimonadaceae bacterium]
MRTFEGTITVRATPAQVFALWADSAGWPRWDPDVKAARIDGPFVAGATGSITPQQGPTLRIRVTRVLPDRAFDAEARLPLCTMRFEHECEAAGDASGAATRVTHRVVFEGPLAFVFRRVIGPSLVTGIPGTMAGLKRAVEAAT